MEIVPRDYLSCKNMAENKLFVPKDEFRKRLLLLRSEIDRVLTEPLTSPDSSLPPALHLVLDYMWCKRQSDLYKVYTPNKRIILEKWMRSHDYEPLPDSAVILSGVVDDDIPF